MPSCSQSVQECTHASIHARTHACTHVRADRPHAHTESAKRTRVDGMFARHTGLPLCVHRACVFTCKEYKCTQPGHDFLPPPSLARVLACALARLLIYLLAHSIARSLARSHSHSLARLLARSLTHSLTHSLTLRSHSLTHSPTCLFALSLRCSLAPSPTCSLPRLLTHTNVDATPAAPKSPLAHPMHCIRTCITRTHARSLGCLISRSMLTVEHAEGT